MSTADFFRRLGEAVERRWREQRHDEAAFAAVAERALKEMPPAKHIDPSALLLEALTDPAFPQQGPNEEFGQPPVTVYRGRRFYIEALYWVDSTTAVHQHAFSGAFHVLAGSSIHTRHRFDVKARAGSHIMVGELRALETEHLGRGATRRILSGDRLIHALFHLERPSVTVVVRTYGPEVLPQWMYLPPGLALDPFHKDPWLEKQIRLIALLRATGRPEHEGALEAAMGQQDFYGATRLLRDSYSHLATPAPGCGERPSHPDGLERLLASGRKRFGSLVDHWRPAFEEEGRQARLMELRQRLHDPRHRLFLAALLNLTDRRAILDFIRRRYRRRSPEALILQWMNELTKKSGEGGAALLPIPFEEGTLDIFRLMLEGRSNERVKRGLAREYSAEQVAALAGDIDAHCDAFRGSLFKPLFVG